MTEEEEYQERLEHERALREALSLVLYYIDLPGQFGRSGAGEALAEARHLAANSLEKTD